MTETEQEHVPNTGPAMDQVQPASLSRRDTLESEDQGETEDEEVKRNCMMGFSGLRDSDFSDTDMDDEDDDEKVIEEQRDSEKSDDPMEEDPDNHLVQFVNGSQMTKPEGIVFRPTPIVPKLAPHAEESDGDVSSSSDSEEEEECLSDNARGASFAYMDNSNDEDVSSESCKDADNDGEEEQIEEAVIQDEEAFCQADAVEESSDEEEEKDGSSDEDVIEDEEGEASENDSEQSGEEAEEDTVYPVIDLPVEEVVAVSEEDMVDHNDAEPEDDDNSALIGASVDDKWTWSKQKRVLSSNTLAALNLEAGRDPDLPKRLRSYSYPPPVALEPLTMPDLSLGAAAFDMVQILPRQSVMSSPAFSSDEEEDRMLSEELEDELRDVGGDNSPIPLLTPPQSPRREDEVEWPSNLVVDSALMNTVTEIRPLSPASLQTMEEEEEKRLKSQDMEASTLTPLLRSICVGMR